ncbi:MAG: discoidin domain-containing protein [Chthoniobacteraceae bacterium]
MARFFSHFFRAACLLALPFTATCLHAETEFLPHAQLATKHFGNDAPWFEKNIPFFECSDSQIEDVYYYRWQLYQAHLKDLGEQGYLVTEFLGDVGWSIKPWQSLNDATPFHISEGRWLKDDRYLNDYINFMYADGGNDRHFSESIAAATYGRYLVNGDRAFAVKQLSAMQYVFNAWRDHYDYAKGLYFIEPVADATEFTIASIDASGGTWGFGGGQAFRPSINSFMYANALAISKLAELSGDALTAQKYAAIAQRLKTTMQAALWNDGFQHFVDRFKVNNKFVHYWDYIRGRELVGYVPWYFEMPDDSEKYAASWKHLLSTDELAGKYGLRTNEPSYEHYMHQYIYEKTGEPECQWNGPAWPFQTTFVLGAMANLLNDYHQKVVTRDDYVRLLKQYAQMHYHDGALDLEEDYNPDDGKVIVGLYRSHHYNHSGFNDLVITGLAGLRPRADDVLEVNPLIPTDASSLQAISYFCLDGVRYHGQLVTILYDRDGKHYGKGAGLSVYVNGKRVVAPSALGRKTVSISKPEILPASEGVDLAVNCPGVGFPVSSASVNTKPGDLVQAVDGRTWFFPTVRNYWSTEGSKADEDWYAVDFGSEQQLGKVTLAFYDDGKQFVTPKQYTVQSWDGSNWTDIPGVKCQPAKPLGNGANTITFAAIKTTRVRVVFKNALPAATALVELKAFAAK